MVRRTLCHREPNQYFQRMLALPGRLERSTLGDIFGELHRQTANGALRLIENLPHLAREHSVQFRSGLIHAVFSPASNALPDEPVPGSASAEVLWHERQLALRLQHLERLEKLFELKSAALRFRALGIGGASSLDRPLHPSDFLHGRPRRRDENRQSRSWNPSRAEQQPSQVSVSQRQLDLATLGLAGPTTRIGLCVAFRTRARQWHPDSNRSESLTSRRICEKNFAALSAAYHRLLADL